MHFHLDELYSFVTGGFFFTLASYSAQSFPKPKNVYGLWLLGIIQFALANKSLGKENFQTAQLMSLTETKNG